MQLLKYFIKEFQLRTQALGHPAATELLLLTACVINANIFKWRDAVLLPKVIASTTGVVAGWNKLLCIYWYSNDQHHFTLPGWKCLSLLCGCKRNCLCQNFSSSGHNWFIRLPSEGNSNCNLWLALTFCMYVSIYVCKKL